MILVARRERKFKRGRSSGRSVLSGLFFVSVIGLQGCAVHYYDLKTGTEHVWGLGHLAMKAAAPQEGQRAVVRGTDLLGISAGRSMEGAVLSLGWDRRRQIEILDQNTAIGLEWPNADFFNVRVGSQFPLDLRDCTHEQKEKTQ